MPKRKNLPKIPDYTGIPTDENKLMVQKSNPLQSLSETGMSLVEFKILDAYLSRINSHDEEKRYVRFEKGELEKILGVSRILKYDLEARLDGLFRVVTIRDGHKKEGFTKIALFEKAEAFQSDDGLWQIDLACSPSALEYVFNLDNIGYLRYRLKNIIELTSRYSYVLYLYLENRRKGKQSKSWTVPLDELKEILRCTADTYNQYKRFNDLILKKCYKELHEKTDLQFTYEPVKVKGRKVIAIHFTVKTLSKRTLSKRVQESLVNQSEDGTNQLSFTDIQNNIDNTSNIEAEFVDGTDIISQLHKVCDYAFTRENIQSAYKFAKTFIHDKSMKIYFEQTYLKLLEIEKKRKIRDRFSYFYQIICSDADRQRKEQQDKERVIGYKPTYDIAEYESTSIIDEFDDEDDDLLQIES